MILIMLNGYFWGGIAWMMFCRAIRLGSDTRALVTIAVSATGTMAIARAIAPMIPDWQAPTSTLDVLLGAAFFLFLYAFIPSWENGPPDSTRRDSSRML